MVNKKMMNVSKIMLVVMVVLAMVGITYASCTLNAVVKPQPGVYAKGVYSITFNVTPGDTCGTDAAQFDTYYSYDANDNGGFEEGYAATGAGSPLLPGADNLTYVMTWNTVGLNDSDNTRYRVRVLGSVGASGVLTSGDMGLDNSQPLIYSVNITPDAVPAAIGQNISIGVNASDPHSGVTGVTADLSGINGSATAALAFNGGTGLWELDYTLVDGNVDNATFNISVTVTNGAALTNTSSDTVNIDNQRPNLPGNVVSVNNTNCSGVCVPGDWLVVYTNLSGLADPGVPPVVYNGSSATDVGSAEVFHDDGNTSDKNSTDNVTSSQINITAGNVDDAAYAFVVLVTDDAGNTQILTATNTVSIDNQGPNVTDWGNITIGDIGGVLGIAGINDGVNVDNLSYNGGIEATGDTVTWTINWSAVLGYGGIDNASSTINLQAGVTDNATAIFPIVVTDDAGLSVAGFSNVVDIDDVPPTINVSGNISLTLDQNNDNISAIGDQITYVIGTLNVSDGDAWTVNLSQYNLSANQTPGVVTIVSDDDDAAFAATETVIDNAGNYITGAVNIVAPLVNIDNQYPVITSPGWLNISFDSNFDGIAAIGDNITYMNGTLLLNDGDNWTINLTSIGFGAVVISDTNLTIIPGDDDNVSMTFVETVTDNAGNARVSLSAGLNIDNEIPAITSGGAINISFDDNSDGIGAIGDNLTYNGGTESTNDTITWGINWSSVLGYGGIDNASSTINLTAGITDNATAAFNIIAMDDAGNIANGTSNTVSIDDIAPTITANGTMTLTLDTNADNISAINDQITYAIGSVLAGDSDTWIVDLSAYGLSANQTAGVITIVEDNDDGAFTATEIVMDDAGNFANASVNVTFAGIDNQRPVVTANGSINISFDSNSDGIAAIGDNITFIVGSVAVGDGDNWSVNLSSIGLGAGVSAGIAQMVIADDDDNPAMVYPQSVIDNAGNPAQPVTQTQPLNIDNEAPAITSGGAINVSFDQNSDGIGAIGDNLTYDGGAESTNDTITWGINWSSILGYGGIDNASSTLALVSGATDNATASFSIIAMDDAGNVDNGTSNTVSIDDIAPLITVNGTMTLTLDTNADNISAINDQITYAIGSVAAADGDAWTVDLSAYGLSANQTAGVITIVEDNDDGAFTAIETVIDNAGNAANASVNVTFAGIDNQRPVVTANGSMNISFDSNSDGIAAIGDNITFIGGTVAVNDGDNWSVNLSSIGLGAGVSAGIAQMVIADDDDNPTMVFPQSVVDNAGNPAQPVTQTQPLNIDNEAPAITSGGAINISFDQNSDGIGAIGDNLTYDGGAESTNDTITWGINWSSILGYGGIDNASSTLTLVLGITDNGTAAFNIIAMDDAGNVDNGTSNTVSIDDIAPIIALAGNVTLTLDQNNDNISAINDQITYTNGSVVAGDNDTWTVNLSHYALSGVQIPGVAVTILPDDDDGPFVANETVIDDAGNSVSGLVALTAPFLLIDNEAPVILNITSPTGLVYTVGDAVTLNANLTQTTPEINNVSANMTVLDSAFSPALLLTDTNFDTVFDGSTSGLNKNTMSPDGTYNVTVLVIDNAGNTANGSIALTLYKDKPVVHGIAITPNPTEGSAIVNVTANIVDDAAVIGAKYSIYTANGSAIVTDQALGAPVDGVWNGTNESLAFDIGGDVAGQLNGVYYIDIYGQDVNGFGFYTRQTFTIGPAIEAPIVINSGPSGVDNDGNVTLTVSTDENATCRYSTVDSAYGIMPNTFTSTGGTAHSQNITGLGDGVYQYYVRCNDTDGNMMSTSAVIQFTVAIPDDSTPPTINVDSVTTTSNSAVIQVDLNDNNPGSNILVSVQYGTTVNYGEGTAEVEYAQGNNQLVYVTGLQPGTTYFYMLNAEDYSENDANVTGSFTTNATDTTAPIVINSGPNGTDSDGNVTLTVTTDENATCKYSTVDSSYATMPNTFTTTGTTAHSEAINGLADGVHQYYVRCTDGVNVMSVSGVIQFTVAIPDDSTPPTINVDSVTTTSNSAVIQVDLNDNNPGSNILVSVQYGTTVNYGEGTAEVEYAQGNNQLVYVTGLQPGTTYFYMLNAEDYSENDANVTGSFTTNATDTTAPIVINSGPLGTDSDGNVTLIVTTDENATCKYSTVDSSYATMPNTFTTTGTTAHSEAINGLAEGVHQYYVRCTDGVNVMTTSAIIQFTVDLPGGDSIPPVITSITLDQPSYRRTQDPLVNMTIVTDVTAVNVTVNNVSATSLGGGLWFYSFAHPTVEGTYSIFVAAIDASNNTNEKEISYSVVANDTVVVPPPVIYFIDLDKPSYEVTNDPNVTITIGEDNNASFIIVEGVVLPGGLEVAPGVWNYTFAHGMTVPGTYSVLVQAIGATGSTVSYMVTYNVVADSPADTTPPAISSVMLDQPEYEMTNDPNVTVTIDEDNTAAFVWVNGALATEAGNTSIWSYTFAHGQASIGTYSVLVQVMDGAGNSATYMISYNVVADAVDTTSPYIIASTPTTMQQNNFQITVTLHDDGAAEAAGVCRYNQGSAFNFRANGGTLMGNLGGGLYQGVISNFTLDGTDDGRYSYYVVCNDSSGNVMVASYYMSVTFDTDGNFNYTQLLETEWSALLLPNPTVILNNWSINDTTLTTLLDNSGLNGDYDTVWYYDVDRSAGNEWISYTTGPAFDDLTTWVNDNNNPYWVHLTTIPSRFQVN